MKGKLNTAFLCLTAMMILSFLIGCSSAGDSSSGSSLLSGDGFPSEASAAGTPKSRRPTTYSTLKPSASGSIVYENDVISIDASNSADGYIMVKYGGSVQKVKVQISAPDGITYTYTLSGNAYETFPLQAGSGTYKIDVLENAYDTMYALAFSQEISVKITDEFEPFLYPNQYVWFTESFNAVKLGQDLSEESSSDLDYIERVYYYVTKNITYDDEKAATVDAGYLPVIDNTLAEKKGICFDYASLMAAMLRSQSIPTKLAIGYSGDAYHAWISVYTKETGWVDKIIEFDGKSWSLMDPTLAANNSSSSVKKYIGDGSNYTVKYYY